MPTIKERIFNIVKDKPGITHEELSVRLHDVAKGSLASQLHDMINRGVVYAKQGDKIKRGRILLGFHTDLTEYKLLLKEPAPVHQASHPSPPAFSVQAIIDPLTMGQARQLYKELHRIFGAK